MKRGKGREGRNEGRGREGRGWEVEALRHFSFYNLTTAIAFSVLHVTFYVQFTSIFNSCVIDVRLSCLY